MTANGGYVYHREYVEACDAWLVFAEDETGAFWFPAGPSCRAMGVDARGQLVVIRADSRLAPWLRELSLPFGQSAAGQWNNYQPTLCLRRREYAWWLAMIDPNNVKPAARANLEARQRALMDLSDRVMFHALDGARTRTSSTPAQSSTPPASDPASSTERPAPVVTHASETHLRCLQCGAPHYLRVDETGARLFLGSEIER